ncbi:hypothetical protein HYX06_03070 [Candidatus Woesearchaeota archaeon]|nr:hypothetical protein [Candidatus Woesearchaeota archaeon]
MAKMMKFFIFISIFLLFLNLAHAASFDVKVTAIKDRIVVDEVAEFEVAIQNNLETEEEFTVKKAGFPFWDMYIKPLQNPIKVKVPAQSSASIRLFVDPLYITSVDTYTLELGVVLDRTGVEQKAPITIGIKSTDPLIQGYIPTVLATISIEPEAIDPRQEFKISVMLNNQNIINYSNLTLKVESGLLKDEIHFQLGPKEDKTIELRQKLDDATPPQKDKLVVAVFKDERAIVNPTASEIEVKEYVTTTELPKEKSFLKIKRVINLFSNNPDYKEPIKVETTLFSNLFLSTSPRAELKSEGGKHYLVWEANLDQDKKMAIRVNENYRPLVVIIALAIASVALYFVFRSPIVVRKSIANVGMSEGGISHAKVVIRVKNRSGSQIANIEVMDHLPHIAHVEKELSIGSMQPHAVMQHPKRGLIIKWNLEVLEPGDERVLSYRMKSRLSILGEFNLPSASARTKIGNKVIITNSNRVTVSG